MSRQRITMPILLSILFVLLLHTVNAGVSGDTDSSFGGDGIVTTPIGTASDHANAVLIQPDGKVIVVGDDEEDFALARYNLDGSLDATFGGGDGIVTTNFGTTQGERATAAALQPDGKIVVAGSADDKLPSLAGVFVARYNPDGSLDKTFSKNGKLETFLDETTHALASGVELDALGRIYVSAAVLPFLEYDYDIAVFRYLTDGTLDLTFGVADGFVDGAAIPDFLSGSNFARDLALQADGKIVVVSSGETAPTMILRYKKNGALDDTFGPGGITFTTADIFSANAVTVKADGKILVAGVIIGATTFDFWLAQYTNTGGLDGTFGGGDGYVTTNFTNAVLEDTDDRANGLALLPDGKIIVVGQSVDEVTNEEKITIARYTAEGVLDTTFNQDGYLQTTFGGTYNAAADVAVFPNSKFMVVGHAQVGGDVDMFVARYHNSTIINASFEQNANGDSLPDFWKGKKLTNDTLRCNAATSPAYDGVCAFRFKGDAAGSDRLQQVFAVNGFANDAYDVSAYVDTKTISDGSAYMRVEFLNGVTLVNTAEIAISDADSAGYVLVSGTATATGAYDQIRIRIEFDGTSGEILIDSIGLVQTASGIPPLPVPLPPAP